MPRHDIRDPIEYLAERRREEQESRRLLQNNPVDTQALQARQTRREQLAMDRALHSSWSDASSIQNHAQARALANRRFIVGGGDYYISGPVIGQTNFSGNTVYPEPPVEAPPEEAPILPSLTLDDVSFKKYKNATIDYINTFLDYPITEKELINLEHVFVGDQDSKSSSFIESSIDHYPKQYRVLFRNSANIFMLEVRRLVRHTREVRARRLNTYTPLPPEWPVFPFNNPGRGATHVYIDEVQVSGIAQDQSTSS